MRKVILSVFILIFCSFTVFAQQKYALVIGNGAYTDLTRLTNPINDANDMTSVLSELGFTVEKIINGNLEQMESAVIRLKDRLSVDNNTYGFFFYAGHGVQSGGENFLIPVDANIPGENYLRNRAVSVQTVLDDLNDANNSLNVVVLDACRDNPFGWSRSGTRGLAMVSRQPADSIIIYATSAGQRASDGIGRNGLFTSQLLANLLTPGLEVGEVFKRTGADVAEVSNRQQIPAIYNQFFGTAYLGEAPDGSEVSERIRFITMPSSAQKKRDPDAAARLWSLGASVGSSFSDPLVIGTARGTIAPMRYAFIELGFDAGFGSTVKEASNYFTLNPFAHLALFLPFAQGGGWYAGAGGGMLRTEYRFDDLVRLNTVFTADVLTGVLLFDFLDISYTLRTNFTKVYNKFSVGYVYRF